MSDLRRPDRTIVASDVATTLRGISASSVGWVDALLRSCDGVYEFTDDLQCVLRVALGKASLPVTLADGTHISLSDPIGVVHFWKEQLPRFTARGPDSLVLWRLTQTFNPAALLRRPFRRHRHELWISRAALARYHGLDFGRAVTDRPPLRRGM
jgi:hypothetical protein